jgi:hypothetical protein
VFDHNGNFLRKFGHLPDSQARQERAEEYVKAIAAGTVPPDLSLEMHTSGFGPRAGGSVGNKVDQDIMNAREALAHAKTGDAPLLDGSAASRAAERAREQRGAAAVIPRAAPIPGAVRFGDTSDAGKLHLPTHCVVSDAGYVFVAEEMQNRISVFKINGEYHNSFTHKIIKQPIAVALGPSNYVYVLLAGRHQINVIFSLFNISSAHFIHYN